MSKILFLCILFKKVVKKSHHQSPSSNIQVVPPPPHSASHIHYPHPLSIHIHPLSIFRWYPCPHTQYHTSTTLEHPLSTVNVHPLSMFIHYPCSSTIHPCSSTIHFQVVPPPPHSASHIHYPGTEHAPPPPMGTNVLAMWR